MTMTMTDVNTILYLRPCLGQPRGLAITPDPDWQKGLIRWKAWFSQATVHHFSAHSTVNAGWSHLAQSRGENCAFKRKQPPVNSRWKYSTLNTIVFSCKSLFPYESTAKLFQLDFDYLTVNGRWNILASENIWFIRGRKGLIFLGSKSVRVISLVRPT